MDVKCKNQNEKLQIKNKNVEMCLQILNFTVSFQFFIFKF